MTANNTDLEMHYQTNLIAALQSYDNIMQQHYASDSSHDLLYEKSCIGLEYCAFLSFFTCGLSAQKKCISPDVLKSLSNEIYKQCQQFTLILEQKYAFSAINICSLINARLDDYKKIFYGDFEPCGFYLTNDYPRYSDNLKDSINRCLIALGDFALYHLKNHEPASFDDLQVVLLLDIFEMSFYQELFDKISVNCITYYKNFTEISAKLKTSFSTNDTNYKQPPSGILTHSNQKNKTNKGGLNFLYSITVLLTIIVFTLSIAFYNQKQTIANQKQYISALEEKTNNLINLVEDYKSLTFKYYTTLKSTENWALKIYNDQLTFSEKRELYIRSEKIFSNDLNATRSELIKKAEKYTN